MAMINNHIKLKACERKISNERVNEKNKNASLYQELNFVVAG